MKIVSFAAIPSLIFWVFGLPLFSLILIIRESKKIDMMKDSVATDDQIEMAENSFKAKWGFMLSGFRKEYYYWEIMLMLKKTIIVTTLVYTATVSSGI